MLDTKREEIRAQSIIRKLFLSGGLALALLVLMLGGLGAAQAREPRPAAPRTVTALDRAEDPVVMTGSHFPAFSGVPLSELVLYAHRAGDWQAIPFQIDEVSVTGTYVISDGGLLDDNDELVFMAADAGDNANTVDWPIDTQARLQARYALTVSDPLSASQQA